MDYTFTKETINLDKLTRELSEFSSLFSGLSFASPELILHATQELNQSTLELIETIIINHNDTITAEESVEKLIEAAMIFGNKLILNFAAQNVLLGITQAGKTKAVADYLADVTRYAQTGSLYEVINEIHRLEQGGIPQDLSPFVTQSRIDEFKSKIMEFLGI